MEKERKVYQIIIIVCALIIGALTCYVDHTIKKYESTITQKEYYYEMGNDLENYILDVVFETDIFDDISEEESEWLEYLIDDGEIGRYYIELITLCERCYGKK